MIAFLMVYYAFLITIVGGLIYLIVLAAGFHPIFWICWLIGMFIVVLRSVD